MIVSYIEKVSCEVYQNEKLLGVPVRGCDATSRRVHRKEWEDSIRWCSTEPQFAVMPPISSSMARFRMLFANIHNYAGRSDSLGTMVLPAKRSVSSIL